jgi:hypothetical protein
MAFEDRKLDLSPSLGFRDSIEDLQVRLLPGRTLEVSVTLEHG